MSKALSVCFCCFYFNQAQQRTGVKTVMDQTSDNLLNGEIHNKESGTYIATRNVIA